MSRKSPLYGCDLPDRLFDMYQQTFQLQATTAHAPQLAPGTYEKLTVEPISGALGADVTGVDLRSLDNITFGEVERALGDHLVLFVRDQSLEPDDLKAFGRRFGKLMHWPYADNLPGHPEITELRTEPEDVYNFGGSWHQDSLNFECPPKITMLYGVECPPVGGDTSFSNQYLAWEALSDDMRARLGDMKAVNSAAKSYNGHSGSDEVKDHSATPLTFVEEQDHEVEHPVARTHPVTGRKALYVNDAFTARFAGESEDESLPLLHELWRHAITPEFTCRFRWQTGTLALWDNRCTMHYAHNDYTGHRRVMHRIVVEGERPV
jgi:taurine dioxygenase